MKKEKSTSSNLAVIILVILFCLASSVVVVGIWMLPQLAVRDFGPSASNVSGLEGLNYAFRLYLNRDDLLLPNSGSEELVPFEIQMGETVNDIANGLQNAGIIRNAEAFRDYLVYSGKDVTIQAGKYKLDSSLNSLEIAAALQDATPSEVDFQILAGWRLEEIAASLPTSGLSISSEDFLRWSRNPDPELLPEGWPELDSLEGFLYPDLYTVNRDISYRDLIRLMLERFDEHVTPEMRTAYQQQGLTLEQAVTLASIVQREAVVDEEGPAIASVFLNRLAVGMKLESDPTVQYSLGYNQKQSTWWTNPLSLNDLKVVSPYNTYINNGLPSGPICSPGEFALNSVAHPEQTTFYYFRAKCDGSGQHFFAETFEEHLQNSCP